MEWIGSRTKKVIESRCLYPGGSTSYNSSPTNEELDSLNSNSVLVTVPYLVKGYSLEIDPPTKQEKVSQIAVSIFSPNMEYPNFYLERLGIRKGDSNLIPIIGLRRSPVEMILSSFLDKDRSLHYLNEIEYSEGEAYARYANNGEERKEIRPFLKELFVNNLDFCNAIYKSGVKERLEI